MTLTQIAVLLSVNLALIVGVMVALWLVALKVRDVSFIDGVWPLAMLFLALVTWPRTEGDPGRKWLLLGIVTLWALRLAWHLLRRWRANGADARYVAILKDRSDKGWSFGKTALLIVFLPQAVLAWLTSLPVQLGQVSATPALGAIAVIGAILAVTGLVFETVGDAQLAAFRKDPTTRGTVLDTGLWRYTRHPNYFGDACVWWGLWLIAAESGAVGLWSIAGPLFLTFTLTRWSGIGITEKAISKSRPGYADYVARTSAFIPWPPKRA
ncbi:DUF1295 domain-containing protein [uncultured Brevundimonas sp.]|uniref:DUF1295 domain-containing protein n=1 Tax=uncultured Brevundimonas sp. TaxID=213418 RepID=UPI0030EBEB4B|tara:strand:- start:70265 stop:71068 length:804 start_codon:yes stop_codon:yes gene_type:complete